MSCGYPKGRAPLSSSDKDSEGDRQQSSIKRRKISSSYTTIKFNKPCVRYTSMDEPGVSTSNAFSILDEIRAAMSS